MAAPIIGAGIGALTSLLGANKQADSSKEAAAIQAQTANRALDINQQVYNTAQAQEAPYLAQGQSAVTRLGALAQGNRPQAMLASIGPRPMGLGQIGQPAQRPTTPLPMMAQPPQPGMTANDPLVTVQAPDGETRQFPASVAQGLVSRGARIVQNGASSGGQPMTMNRAM